MTEIAKEVKFLLMKESGGGGETLRGSFCRGIQCKKLKVIVEEEGNFEFTLHSNYGIEKFDK